MIFKGNFGEPIACQLLDAYVDEVKDGVPYEALSYAWGDTATTQKVIVDGSNLPVTENLYQALQYLRSEEEDRILWIDAICIDQGNIPERGHQVRHMREIYKQAWQVIVWLGSEYSDNIECVMNLMKYMQKEIVKIKGNWRGLARRLIASYTAARHNTQANMASYQAGFDELLTRPWFRRVWIIQEIASARVATIACGPHTTSARVFSNMPEFISFTPNHHCQSVLDIMPGPAKASSWWSRGNDLSTLLLMFQQSLATDLRDMVFALIGISSDAQSSAVFQADYGKSLGNVIGETILFLLFKNVAVYTKYRYPDWSFPEVAEHIRKRDLYLAYLTWALQDGHVPTVELLLTYEQVGFEPQDVARWLPLIRLAQEGGDEIVNLVLHWNKIDVRAPNIWGKPLLFQTVLDGDGHLVSLLLQRDHYGVDLRDTNGNTLLILATISGCVSVVQSLLSDKSLDLDCNARDKTGKTALLHAMAAGKVEIVALLLADERVDVCIADENENTALMLAIESKSTHLLNLPFENMNLRADRIHKSSESPLIFAASRADYELMDWLLTCISMRPDRANWSAAEALQIAARKGHDRIVSLLVRYPHIDINTRAGSGNTPLMNAYSGDHSASVAALLLHPSINVNLQDSLGKTALVIACERGFDEIVAMLLQCTNIDINIQDRHYLTALLYTVQIPRRLNTFKLFLKHPGIDLNACHDPGQTLLEAVIKNNRTSILELLLEQPALNINLMIIGFTFTVPPLTLAIQGWHVEIVRLLLTREDLDINLVSHKRPSRNNLVCRGWSPLFFAVAGEKIDIVEILLRRSDVNRDLKDFEGLTPLELARKRGFQEICHLLEDYGPL